jgi:hypothetical protein
VSSAVATAVCNGNLPLGDIPGWDNHNPAGFADAGLGTGDPEFDR